MALLVAVVIGWGLACIRVETPTQPDGPPAMPTDLQVTELSRTDSTATYQATWECVEEADRYVVSAGSNEGRWSFSDTLEAGSCSDGTATRTLVMRTK